MGFFDKLFSRGPRKPPEWAEDFDAEKFARFCDVIIELLEKEGYERNRDDIRSGSVMVAHEREWIFHELAARCAGAPESEWPKLARDDFEGKTDEPDDDDDERDDEEPPPPMLPRRQQVIAYLLHGDLERADALCEGDEELLQERAMIALMRDDEEAALGHLAKTDTPQAKNSRALLLARRKDPRALDEAKAAVAALPEDPIAIHGAVIVHALLGDLEGARAILAKHGGALNAEARVRLELGIEQPPEQGPHRFPELAETAYLVSKTMLDEGRPHEAEPILRRANQWDPNNLSVATELGYALSKLGRDGDAIAVYDAQIERGGSNVLLRFNRGNCRLRMEKLGEAGEDFRACLELKPDWHEARVNLVSVLFAAKDLKGAERELGELKQRGGPPQLIAQLEKMLAGRL